MNKPISIMIADDHTMVREGVRQLLELDGDIVVVAEASSGKQCIELLDENLIDVLLLDVNMPNMNGLQVLQHIRETKRNVKVLMLTVHNEVEYLIKAIDLGVDGYVLKDSDSSLLKKAIISVYEGVTFIQPELAPILKVRLDVKKTSNNNNFADLTKRELTILKLLSEGLFNKEIAYILAISEKTVKNHVASIFRKIDVSDRTQAAIYAFKNDIVDLLAI